MTRVILTFDTLFRVLAADKLLRAQIRCRPTPTPPGIGSSLCGMALELLDPSQQQIAIDRLKQSSLEPNGIHELK